MKKLFALLLALMMLFALAACGENNTTDPDKDSPAVTGTAPDGSNAQKVSPAGFLLGFGFYVIKAATGF